MTEKPAPWFFRSVAQLSMDELDTDWGRMTALLDDRYWSAVVTGWFSWQSYADWWAARRWCRPRDIRRD